MAIVLKTKVPGPKSIALMQERTAAVARGPFHVTPIFAAQAEGATIEDVDGNRFIDFSSGIGVTNLGHRSKRITEALQQQLQKFLHVGFNVTPYENYIRLCQKLNSAFPQNGRTTRAEVKSFLANSGAEAVENAIKIARAATNRQAVICFDHAFHGRTYMAMSLTSKYKPYKYNFGPYNSEIYRAPFPYSYRWPTNSDPKKVSEEALTQLKALLNYQLSPTQVAAIIIEPVLGEGGFVPMPVEFAKGLRQICDEFKIVLVADEIQSGFGRTGKLFACDTLGISPDLLVTAKGLAGGMPVSAVTGLKDLMDAPIEGGIGGTFGGNPLAVAAALAVFESFEKDNILPGVQKLSETLEARLMAWREKFPMIGEVRGLGVMRAIEFVKSKNTREPSPEAAKALTKYSFEHGVISMTAGTYGNVVRLLMPLTISAQELEEGLNVLEDGLKTL